MEGYFDDVQDRAGWTRTEVSLRWETGLRRSSQLAQEFQDRLVETLWLIDIHEVRGVREDDFLSIADTSCPVVVISSTIHVIQFSSND